MDIYDRVMWASVRYSGWFLLWLGLAVLMLAMWGYYADSARAQPVNQLNVVVQCPTGVLDANGNPVVVPCYVTPVVAVGTGTTGAVTATMAAVAAKTNYICGFAVSALGGTATVGPITISNLIGNLTFTFQQASSASGLTLTQGFWPCIPAKAVNTTIAVATTADGTATAVDVNVWGYVQ